MKYLLILSFLFISFSSFSQLRKNYVLSHREVEILEVIRTDTDTISTIYKTTASLIVNNDEMTIMYKHNGVLQVVKGKVLVIDVTQKNRFYREYMTEQKEMMLFEKYQEYHRIEIVWYTPENHRVMRRFFFFKNI